MHAYNPSTQDAKAVEFWILRQAWQPQLFQHLGDRSKTIGHSKLTFNYKEFQPGLQETQSQNNSNKAKFQNLKTCKKCFMKQYFQAGRRGICQSQNSGGRGRWVSVSSRLWFTEGVPGQPGLQREILSQNTSKQTKQQCFHVVCFSFKSVLCQAQWCLYSSTQVVTAGG